MSIKDVVRKIPVVGSALERAIGADADKFSGSKAYWENRYASGGNSGAGSYNRLAEFKAEYLNAFVAKHQVQSVIEFGSGDGAQLKLAKYPSYIGVDVSQLAVDRAREDFADAPSYSFMHTSEVTSSVKAELSLSLDVVYHLVEDDVFETYMACLVDAATRYVIVYASNEDRPWANPHVRHRKFTNWIDKNRPNLTFVEHVPNRYPFDEGDRDHTSFADFYVYQKAALG